MLNAHAITPPQSLKQRHAEMAQRQSPQAQPSTQQPLFESYLTEKQQQHPESPQAPAIQADQTPSLLFSPQTITPPKQAAPAPPAKPKRKQKDQP
jgi:hypothetical protein